MNDPKKGGYTTPCPALDLTTSLRGDWYFTKGSVTGAPLPDPPPLLRGAPTTPPRASQFSPRPEQREPLLQQPLPPPWNIPRQYLITAQQVDNGVGPVINGGGRHVRLGTAEPILKKNSTKRVHIQSGVHANQTRHTPYTYTDPNITNFYERAAAETSRKIAFCAPQITHAPLSFSAIPHPWPNPCTTTRNPLPPSVMLN